MSVAFSRWFDGREYGVAVRGHVGGEQYLTLDMAQVLRDCIEAATTPLARAEMLEQIDQWAAEPDYCRYPMCGNWAETQFCAHHMPDAA